MMRESEGMTSQYPKRIGLLLVSASILAMLVIYVLDITFLYEPKYLLGVTNTIFTAIIPVIVAFFAARTYQRTGSFSVLLMGCGMLGFGLFAGLAGWLREMPGGANVNVTIYNTGALLGSLCHVAGAVISYSRKSDARELKRQRFSVIPAYAAIIVFAVLFSFATVRQLVPPFFIQGSGSTALRQFVLGLAILLYALSSFFFMNHYFRIKSDFLYWYSLCLAMLALGLFAFYIEKIVGSPIGWVGRTSNYVGTILSLVAILAAARSGKSKGLSLEKVISGFFVDAEANYKSLVETASDAIISFDRENRIILWNSSAEKIFGYTKGEATGSPLFGMFIPDEHANTLKELIEGSQDMSFQNTVEIVGRHKNGRLFPIELSAFGRKHSNEWVGTCILRDITERKRAEEALLFKENVIKCSSSLISTRGLEGKMTYGNPSFLNQWGFDDPGEFVGKPFWEFWSVKDRLDEILQALRDDGSWFGEIKAIRKDGALFDVQVSAAMVFDKSGNPVALTSTSTDITERKRAEQALREGEQRLRLAMNTAGLAIWDWDITRNTVRWDNPWETLFDGPPDKENAYEFWAERIHPEDRDAVISALNDALAGGEESLVVEYRFRRTDGTWANLYDRSHIMREKSGRAYRAIGAVMDMTDLRRAEEELRQARDKLERRVEERTVELENRAAQLSRLSSELTMAEQRERLRIAKILHDHLQQLMVGAKIGQEVLIPRIDIALKPAAEQVLDLINQSIKASRSLTAELSPTVLRSGDLSASLEWLARWIYENQGLEVKVQTESRIVLDRKDLTVLLFQSIRELLFNVLKHAGVKSAAVTIERKNGELRIVVKDRGVGFDPQTVWENSDTEYRFGLFTIRERLLRLDGRFEIESAPNAGSTISLIVPLEEKRSTGKMLGDLSRESHEKPISVLPGTRVSTDKIRVMIVDDHPVVRQGLARILGLQSDIEVVGEASDGEKACHLTREIVPGVILMDINMPNMDGLEATRIIHSEFPHIRIIGLSMYDEDDQAVAMIRAGASAYRSKDDNIDLLLAAIRGEAE